jgi:hypothetical protein
MITAIMITTVATRMQTLARSYEEILDRVPGYPWVPLGNFMQDFFRNFPDERAELLADPPQVRRQWSSGNQSEEEREAQQWTVFCAASAEYLAHKYGLVCPAWVHDPVYAPLSEPWYFAPMAYKKENVRQRAERTTPLEFARRNIYCGDKIYVDKYAEAQKLVAIR